MHLTLKILFSAPLLLNLFAGAFFFITTTLTLLLKSDPVQGGVNGLIVLLGCSAILGLAEWAYYLAFEQARALAGLGVLALSYLVWPAILLAIATFGKVHWQ